MKVVEISRPGLGIDCVTVLTDKSAAALRAEGIGFAVRYLGGLSAAEVTAILMADLLLSVVTYSRAPGWVPTPGMGTSDGQTDLAHLKAAGIVPGCTVWIDLEGCAGTADEAAAWVGERSAVLRAAGFDVGLYVGSFQPMNAAQLYALPGIDRYWRSLSSGVPEPACGWSFVQLWDSPSGTDCGGVNVDFDAVQRDHKGRYPFLLAA